MTTIVSPDLVGPVNKAAYAFAAGMVPSLAMARASAQTALSA